MDLVTFKQTIWKHYHENKRPFPWRETTDPYKILVSELMLQQTQTDRVVPKYEAFLERFPTIDELSKASQVEVLSYWQGLGYNRRALYLHKTSQQVANQYNSKLPKTKEELLALPGIGPYTSSAVLAFAYNQPTIFIETNIRSVFIHFFFPEQTNVSDKELLPLIEETVDTENPREWYYALMDYGVLLKKLYPNPSRKSKHHVKQSKFEGSDRQIRGQVIRRLLNENTISYSSLLEDNNNDKKRIDVILDKLEQEGFITKDNDSLVLNQ